MKADFSMLIILIMSYSCSTNTLDLRGNWLCNEYDCNNTKKTEIVNVIFHQGNYIGIKTIGDNCIGKNDTTWVLKNIKGRMVGYIYAGHYITKRKIVDYCYIISNNKDSFKLFIPYDSATYNFYRLDGSNAVK